MSSAFLPAFIIDCGFGILRDCDVGVPYKMQILLHKLENVILFQFCAIRPAQTSPEGER